MRPCWARTAPKKDRRQQPLSGAIGRLSGPAGKLSGIEVGRELPPTDGRTIPPKNRIALARHDYNEALRRYNTMRELFPKNIAASMFGFQRNDSYFKANEEEKKVPAVRF